MKYCYSNNGLSFRAVADDYAISDGEALFNSAPTASELETAFSGYTAALLAQAQETALASIANAADEAYSAGFGSTAADGTTTLYYDSDEKERLNFVSAANLAASDSTQFDTNFANGYPIHSRTSLDADDSTKTEQHLTATEMVQLGTDWITRVMAVKEQVWALKDSINACTTAAEVEAITISIT